MDLATPKFSGLDIIKSLKEDGALESNNIVVLLLHPIDVLEEIKSSGIKEIFKNPCSLDDLTAVLEKYRPPGELLITHSNFLLWKVPVQPGNTAAFVVVVRP